MVTSRSSYFNILAHPHTDIHTQGHAHAPTGTQTCAHILTYTHKDMHMYLQTHTQMHTCTHPGTHTQRHVHILRERVRVGKLAVPTRIRGTSQRQNLH